MNKNNKNEKIKELKAFRTLALADPHKIDPDDKTTTPSIDAVEDIREWSIENKK